MDALLIINDILSLVFVPIAIFFGKEFLKKFGFMQNFVQNSNHLLIWHHLGTEGRKPGMYNIVLRGAEPFCALIGFKLKINFLGFKRTGFDYYGFVRSDSLGRAVISTYLGKGSCEFQFFINTDLNVNPIIATSSANAQCINIKPDAVYPPHWYQRIGFYS